MSADKVTELAQRIIVSGNTEYVKGLVTGQQQRLFDRGGYVPVNFELGNLSTPPQNGSQLLVPYEAVSSNYLPSMPEQPPVETRKVVPVVKDDSAEVEEAYRQYVDIRRNYNNLGAQLINMESPVSEAGVTLLKPVDAPVSKGSESIYIESKTVGDSNSVALQNAIKELKSSGEDAIKEVQTELYNRGYYKGKADLDSVVDGKVGPATRRALTQYLKDVYDGAFGLKDYTKTLEAPVSGNMLRTLYDSYLDMRNLQRWKKAVAKSTETDEEGIPVVDYDWNVSADMLTRAAGLLPKDLSAKSVTEWTSPTRAKGSVGYPDTWDSPAYIKENDNAIVSVLRKLGGLPGAAATSLGQPGRGTIGNFVYKTTPAGIVISDGYQFYAKPSSVVISGKQSKGYNDLRSKMNVKHRGRNKNTQTYLIPWDVYNEINSESD